MNFNKILIKEEQVFLLMVNKLSSKIFYLLLTLIFLSYGCAATRVQFKEEAYPKESYLIPNVPFYKQSGNTCGPAALASVLGYWGIEFDYANLVQAIYSPKLRGSLDFDLSLYPRNLDLWSKYYQANFEDLREKIKQGIPLIVLQKESPWVKNSHYIVVFGFDDKEKRIFAHTGIRQCAVRSYRKFLKRWKEADCGTVLVCPPEKVIWSLDVEDYIYLGYLLEKRNFLEKAVDIYLKAIAVEPQAKIAHFNLGNVYLKMDEFAKAEESFRKAIQLDAQFADAYNNLACVYLSEKKNLDEAEELVKKALELNPGNKGYYLDTLNQINEAQTYGTK